MNDKAYRVLEYGKIINLLTEEAYSGMARKQLSELKPSTSLFEIENALRETTEAVRVIMLKGSVSLGSFYDINECVGFAGKGGVLTPKQLLEISYNLRSARNASAFLKQDMDGVEILAELGSLLTVHKKLEDEIDRCILSEDEIADSASAELRSIRRGMVQKSEAVKVKLNSILTSADSRTMLQDALFTMRQGRYVIPVKQEYKAKFPGIVHDQSSTGATLFIEPQAVVNLNNELRELEIKEKIEIERILAELSGLVAEASEQILANQDILIRLDFIFAKGKFSVKYKASKPEINKDGYIQIIEGRHPLIGAEKVVPLTIRLGKGYDTLVITGPNTGGKTVTLKTVGLLQMMAQSGLHVPAEYGTKLSVFERIYADIGDEQSIEQSLSTFSSHMKNIVDIVSHADENTLVLLDELGAGTDPTEGAALAISVLDHLYKAGTKTIATTHYTELKKYAIVTTGVENASVEFDITTLSPTYRLSIGTPGRSNAFEISRKLGLPDGIIREARGLLGNEDVQFEEILSKIENNKKEAEAERDEAIRLNIEIKKVREEVDIQKRRLAEQKEKIIAKAKEEARDMIKEAKEFADEIQKELKALEDIEDSRDRNRQYERLRKKVKDKSEKYKDSLYKTEEQNHKPVRREEIGLGERVKIVSLDQKGNVLTLPDDKGELMLQVGLLKVNAKLSDIVKISGEKENKKAKTEFASMRQAKAFNISSSISLRGFNLDDALMEIDKYLDDAYIAGLRQVSVIHGKGEGVLKAGLRDFFKRHRLVAEFETAPYSEGGDGVTIVHLKT